MIEDVTKIQTVEGQIPIRELVGKEIDIYCMDKWGNVVIGTAKNIRMVYEIWEVLYKKPERDLWVDLIQIKTSRGDLICDKDQQIYTKKGWLKITDLQIKDRLIGLNRKMGSYQQAYVALSGKKYIPEHRFVAGHYHPIPKGYDVHHLNGIHIDNRKSNLQIISHSRHSLITNLGHLDYNDHGADGKFTKKDTHKSKDSYQLFENPVGTNLRIVSIATLDYTENLYTLDVAEYNNFIGNGLVLHC